MSRQFQLASLILLMACGAGCSSHSVLGVWTIADSGNGLYYFGHYAYLDDGRKCTLLFEYYPGDVRVIAYLNQWAIEDDVLTLTYGRSNGSVREGHVSRSRILELNEYHFVYQIFDPVYPNIRPEVTIRHPNSDPERVCAVAAMVLNVEEFSQ